MQFDVGLFELAHGRRELLIGQLRLPTRTTHLLLRPRGIGLQGDGFGGVECGDLAGRVAHFAQFGFEHRELAHVFTVHALGDILERPHGFFAGIPLGDAGIGQVEQRNGRRNPLGGAGAEDLAWLVQRQHGPELSLHPKASQRQHSAVQRRGKTAQARVVGRSVGDVEKWTTRQNPGPNRLREVIERGLDTGPMHLCAHGV